MAGLLCALAGLLFVPLLFVLVVYNSLIGDRNMADNAFSTIDVMLKKRWDLIPNLVAMVKGYMQHESETLQRVSELRSAAMSATDDAQRFAAESELTSALGQLRVVVEKYPDLKANENMLHLQRSLTECEEQISAARRSFNAAILQFNNRVEMFPHNLVAQWFGFQRRAFFEIETSERQAPSVASLN
jgi:LemA protein